MKDTLKPLLLEKINSTQGWISKGSLYIVAEQEEYSPEYCGRVLRKLAEDNLILVDYYLGKRGQTLARYARLGEAKPLPPKPTFKEIEKDGIRVMVMV